MRRAEEHTARARTSGAWWRLVYKLWRYHSGKGGAKVKHRVLVRCSGVARAWGFQARSLPAQGCVGQSACLKTPCARDAGPAAQDPFPTFAPPVPES